jgi:hypothetical protein
MSSASSSIETAGFDATDVGLTEHQLVEGNVAGRAESDLGDGENDRHSIVNYPGEFG